MNFGYSLGDFVTVGQLAWNVYKSCKEAPDSFANISNEVLSLHIVLKEVEELLSEELASDPHLPASKLDNLTAITEGCQNVLQDLEAVTKKYESLGSRSKWTWDRIRWGSNNIAELRQRLTSNIVMLSAFVR
jgi:predicted transcriptional regulator